MPARAAFIRYESERILDEYGNHPSFVMMSTGNEQGDAYFTYEKAVALLVTRGHHHE